MRPAVVRLRLRLRLDACLVALLAVGAAGCFQELDSRASSEALKPPVQPPGGHTVALTTPSIGVVGGDEGQTTDDACEAVTTSALDVLRRNCAACHGGGPGQNLGQPAFDFVLDVTKLLAATSSTVKDPQTMQPVHFLVPGDPDHSRVYVRMYKREMPPGDIVGLPNNPNRPTVSDISVVRDWISQCVGSKPAGGGDDQGENGKPADAGKPPGAADAGAPGEGDDMSPAARDAAAGGNDAGARPAPDASVTPDAASDAPSDVRRRFDGRLGTGAGG